MNDDLQALKSNIKNWACELGFDQTGFSTTDLGQHEARFINWLDKGFHGEMQYMRKHAALRTAPADLHAVR